MAVGLQVKINVVGAISAGLSWSFYVREGSMEGEVGTVGMSTLTVDDMSKDWPWVDITTDDTPSARIFWLTLLQFADADGGVAVEFLPWLGDRCLAVRNATGERWVLEPPPKEFWSGLIHVGRDLLAGGPWQGLVWWWMALTLRRKCVGHIAVEAGSQPMPWSGEYLPGGIQAGLVFFREAVGHHEAGSAKAMAADRVSGTQQRCPFGGVNRRVIGWKVTCTPTGDVIRFVPVHVAVCL
jgi:hypothetical protein